MDSNLPGKSGAKTLTSFLRTALGLTRPYRGRFGLGIVCGFIAGLTNPLLMGSVKVVFEVVFPRPDAPPLSEQFRQAPAFLRSWLESLEPAVEQWRDQTSFLPVLVVVSLIPLAMLLRGAFSYLNIYLMNWVTIRAVTDLRTRVFEHLLGLSASFYSRTSTGELMSRLGFINNLQNILSQSIVVLVREPITIVGLLALLLWQQPLLTLVTLVVFPVAMAPWFIYARKLRRSSAAIVQQTVEMGNLMHESFTGYRVIKAYNLEKRMVSEFLQASRQAISHFMRILRASEIPGPMMEFFAAVGVGLLLAYIAVFARQTTPGDLLQFIGSIFLMYQPIKALARLHNQVIQAQAATQYAFDLLEVSSPIVEPAHPQPLQAAQADVRFEGVSFSYGDKPAVCEVRFTAQAGQVTALVGASGSGKTTLTNLLVRFYDPQSGAIRIGPTDIRQVASRELRRQIALVTQETILFNDTVRNNIALGRPGATEEEIVAAARHAYAHEFIMQKPHGYNTVVGEKGVTLSGGQRQRIALARAILKDAPILILDEATSALDTESERAIQRALEELMQDRTTICIAHRLSTIQKAHLIVVLSEGRVVEMGNHAELIGRKGHYKKLHDLQFQV